MAKQPENNMTFNQNVEPNKGITGYAQNSMAKQRMNNFAFNQNTGFLDSSVANAKALQNEIAKIEALIQKSDKAAKSMTASQQRAMQHAKSEAELLIQTLQEAKNTGSLSQAELNQLVKDNETTSKEAIKVLKTLISGTSNLSKELLKDNKDLVEQTNLAIAEQNKTLTENKQAIKDLNTELANTQDKASKGLANTLKSAGNTLTQLTNMMNIQSLANNQANSTLQQKYQTRASVMRTLSMDSNSQFESFRKSLNTELRSMNKSMGSIFNTDDMYQFMDKLATYGINNEEMAQQQMRSAMISTKYLGTTDETMSAIFKYMKRTNNSDAVNEHNKTITGILRSIDGVSKEQLDALTQTNYDTTDALAALGLDTEGQNRFLKESSSAEAALSSINSSWGDTLANTFNEMVAMPFSEASAKYGKVFGQDFQSIYDELALGNAANATTLMANSSGVKTWLNSMNNMSAEGRSETLSVLGLNPNMFNMLSYMSNSETQTEYLEKMNQALDNIANTTNSDVEQYAEDTSGATALDKISNGLSAFFDGPLSWNIYSAAAIAAFTSTAIGGIIDLAGDLKSVGGFKNLFKSFFGKGSEMGEMSSSMTTLAQGGGKLGSVLGSVATVGGGVLLGVGAAKVISNAIEDAQNKTEASNIKAAASELKGTSLEGNSTAQTLTGLGNTYADENNNFMQEYGSAFSTTMSGLGVGLFGWLRDLKAINQDDWKFVKNDINMRRMNAEDAQAYTTAFALLLMSAKRQSDVDDFANLNTKDMAAYLKSKGWSRRYLDSVAADLPAKPNKTSEQNQETIDWSYLNMEGYHKNGLSWVPRDNYKALLHKGEMILNSKEAKLYRDAIESGVGLGGESDSSNAGTSSPILTGYPWPMTSGWPRYPSSKKQHRGLDWGIPEGTSIGASYSGTVVAVERNNFGKTGYGNFVRILGDNGRYFRFGHLSKPLVNVGDKVSAGQLIGLSGNTGNSTGPHLHYQVDSNENYTSDVNPYNYITPGLFQATGNIPSYNSTVGDQSSTSTQGNNLGSKMYIPKSLIDRNTGGIGGPELNGSDKVVNSVDGGFNRLISYLDNIQKEQNEQRALLETYSISKSKISNYS